MGRARLCSAARICCATALAGSCLADVLSLETFAHAVGVGLMFCVVTRGAGVDLGLFVAAVGVGLAGTAGTTAGVGGRMSCVIPQSGRVEVLGSHGVGR